jgi:hypothetical protein
MKPTECGMTRSCPKVNFGAVGADDDLLDRSTPIGQMINSYLLGQSEQEDHVIHLLFSANRWELA